MVDEVWYSSSTYNFITSGVFENVNVGYGGNGIIVYMLYLSAYFYIFGVSLFTARLSSFLMGIVSILIVRKMLKVLNISEFNILLSLSFFAFSNLYLSIFKLTRPESLALVFSLCILLTTYYYLNKDYNLRFLFLLIFFSFLAINSHPNSSIIILLSFLIIFYFIIKEKKYSKLYHLFLMILGVTVSMVFLTIMIAVSNNVSINVSLSNLLSRNTVNANFVVALILKFDVTIKYFLITNRIITFVPQMFLIIAGLFFAKRNKYIFGISVFGTASLCIALLFLSPSGFPYVFPYVFIFSAFTLSLLLKKFENQKHLKRITIIFAVSVIFLNIIANLVHTKNTFDPNINSKMREINALLPDKSLIISESPFWFISPQKDIKNSKYLFKKKISLEDKDFYIINCDKFTSDFKIDSSSVAYLNTYGDNHNIDTLLKKESKIYGNIFLIKHTKR
jgi:hypothetical protein